jgi:fructose-bisphosphate aldolase class I
VTERGLHTLFRELYLQRVRPEGLILKPNMVLPGSTCATQQTDDELAAATVERLFSHLAGSGAEGALIGGARLIAKSARQAPQDSRSCPSRSAPWRYIERER